MAIQKEIWQKDIQGNLFPDNSFVMRSSDDSDFVLGGHVVHIPQAGLKPTVVKNRTSLPATVSQRTDSDVTYTLDEYTTDPILVQNTEEVEVSYAKRQNIMSEQQMKLQEDVANALAYAWAPTLASNIVKTSGTTRATTAASATGTRKAPNRDDFVEVRRLLNRMEVPLEGRVAVIPADFEADILKIDGFVDVSRIGEAKLIEGIIGRLLGFDIYVRSSTVIYDNTGTPIPKAPGAAGAATDNLSGLFYHPNFVARAIGQVSVFLNEADATFYGDVFSALVRAGGRKKRSTQVGVVSLVETWVS